MTSEKCSYPRKFMTSEKCVFVLIVKSRHLLICCSLLRPLWRGGKSQGVRDMTSSIATVTWLISDSRGSLSLSLSGDAMKSFLTLPWRHFWPLGSADATVTWLISDLRGCCATRPKYRGLQFCGPFLFDDVDMFAFLGKSFAQLHRPALLPRDLYLMTSEKCGCLFSGLLVPG